MSRSFPALRLLELSSVRYVTGGGVTQVVRRCRQMQALLVTHLVGLAGDGWLQTYKVPQQQAYSIRHVDASGSPCARAVPVNLRAPDEVVKSLLRRTKYRDLIVTCDEFE